MKLRVMRAASAFILAGTLLAGCGDLAGQTPYASSAAQAVQAAEPAAHAAGPAAQGVMSGAKKATPEGGAGLLSGWPQPLRSLQAAGSAAARGAFVGDWWQSVSNRFVGEAHGLAGGGRLLEARPQQR